MLHCQSLHEIHFWLHEMVKIPSRSKFRFAHISTYVSYKGNPCMLPTYITFAYGNGLLTLKKRVWHTVFQDWRSTLSDMAGEKRTAFSQDGSFKQPQPMMIEYFSSFIFWFKMAEKYSEWVFCWVYKRKVLLVTFDEAVATETLPWKHVLKCLKRIFLELKMSWLWTLFLLQRAIFLMFDLFDPKVLWCDYVLVFFVQQMTLF